MKTTPTLRYFGTIFDAQEDPGGFDKANRNGLSTAHIPRPIVYIGVTDAAWWEANGTRFPPEFPDQANLLMSERILPLPKAIREALIRLYCPEHLKERAIVDPLNKDCLVRVYLGKDEHPKTPGSRPPEFFTLRNFKLHLNQIKDLNLDVNTFATLMVNALVILHWEIKIDGGDVEFVLGSAPTEAQPRPPSSELIENMKANSSTYSLVGGMTFHKRVVHLWMLDLTCAKNSPWMSRKLLLL